MILKEKAKAFNLKTPYYVSRDASQQGLDRRGSSSGQIELAAKYRAAQELILDTLTLQREDKRL
jgi:hypothetical protein